jgi:hypothetical protein
VVVCGGLSVEEKEGRGIFGERLGLGSAVDSIVSSSSISIFLGGRHKTHFQPRSMPSSKRETKEH